MCAAVSSQRLLLWIDAVKEGWTANVATNVVMIGWASYRYSMCAVQCHTPARRM